MHEVAVRLGFLVFTSRIVTGQRQQELKVATSGGSGSGRAGGGGATLESLPDPAGIYTS